MLSLRGCFTSERISLKASRPQPQLQVNAHGLGPQTGLLCPPGCNPVLDGSGSAQNGLEGECANEEYTLMSIDNIINGKVTYSC